MATATQPLEQLVLEFLQASLAVSTKKVYRTHLQAYLKFCDAYELRPVPASSHQICLYIAHLSKRLAYNSIRQYINIIMLLHRDIGLENPIKGDAHVAAVLKGVKRIKGSSVFRKPPNDFSFYQIFVAYWI